ncbi:DUF6221 family protein [Nocardioides kribbensis]|uniref:DUF6221 family protein n=1 Tax=Nocardioides kribbensis TaxID=305517 RepID=UPI00187AC806|nr:DUF6221 family protein [Nocardioides kribbensis]
MTLIEFLTARLDEDETVARECAEVFPTPWEIADRGWRVRIYSAPVPDLGDHAEPGWERVPVVMEVEPDRNLEDPKWLSERVEHIARHDPARVLAEVAAKRAIVEGAVNYSPELEHGDNGEWALEMTLQALASVYVDHPDYRDEWKP